MTKLFPQQGKPWEELKQEMLNFKQKDVNWKQGRAAVYVFDPGPE